MCYSLQSVSCSHPMCSSNYCAENTPHSFRASAGRGAVDLRPGDRKRERFSGTRGQIPLFRLKLLLLWVKLERSRRWNGFGSERSRMLGRAKKKRSGWAALGGGEQHSDHHKLHRKNSLADSDFPQQSFSISISFKHLCCVILIMLLS